MFRKNKQLNCLIFTHMWEFFSTYGMISLLTLFLLKTFHLPDSQCYSIYGAYLALLYSSPLISNFLMKENEYENSIFVVIGGILMALGHFTIVLKTLNSTYISLALMVSGYGLFTPSLIHMTAAVKSNTFCNDRKFTYYYVGQNIGSFLAPIVCSFIGIKYGWNYGFAVAGLGMITGLVVFYKNYRQELSKSFRHVSFSKISIYVLFSCCVSYFILSCRLSNFYTLLMVILCFLIIFKVLKTEDYKTKKRSFYIFFMMFFMMIFFALLSLGGSTLVFFFERLIDRKILGFEIPTPALMSIESMFMIILSPLFIFKKSILNKYLSKFILPTQKYILGLFIMSLAFFVFYFSANTIQTDMGKISLIYVFIGFFLFPIAELLIMPIGYSIVTKYSPSKSIKLILATWVMAQAVSRKISDWLSELSIVNNNTQFVSNKILSQTYSNAFLIYFILLLISSAFLFVIRNKMNKLIINNKLNKIG